jgi:hypothetical protein
MLIATTFDEAYADCRSSAALMSDAELLERFSNLEERRKNGQGNIVRNPGYLAIQHELNERTTNP